MKGRSGLDYSKIVLIKDKMCIRDRIDVEHGAWVSDAIEKAWAGQKMPKNLGSCYARSFGYREQEQFLKGIQNARCKMLVCNYDLQLYDRYLRCV